MKTSNRRLVLASSCAAAALAAAGAASAQAVGIDPGAPGPTPAQKGASRSDAGARAAATNQDTAAGSSTAVSEVVVTAANRASTLQSVPAAVTAFTDERRNLLGIETGRDIANLTPSVSLQGEFLTVRGVGRYLDPGRGLDPGIAVHVDGVYTSSPAYLNQPDFLTDRIEVLRGPQSVFGRNSIGGAVNVYSKRPTADLHGDFRAGYTSEEAAYADAAVSGPITDKLRFRADYAWSNTQDGAQNNVAPGYANPGTGSTRLYELQLEADPTPDTNVWVRYQGFSSNLRGSYGVQTGLGTGTNLYNGYLTGTPANFTTVAFFGLAPNPQFGLPANSNPALANRNDIALDDPGHIDLKNDHTFTINASWDLHWATLKYVGGYSQYDYQASLDADGTARATQLNQYGLSQSSYYEDEILQQKKWYSHELSLVSRSDQPLRWVLGLYDYSERYKTAFSVTAPFKSYLATPVLSSTTLAPAATNPTRAFYAQTTTLRSDNQAVYGQLEYDVAPTVKVTGDFRYSWDQRFGGNRFRQIYDLYGFFGPYVPMVGLDVTPAIHDVNTHRDFSDGSGKISAQWQPDRSLNAYATIARGYKSGGFNLGGFQVIPSVEPETLTDYEAGLKKTFGKMFSVDAALYYYDYKNLQVPVTVGTTTVNPVTGGNITNFSTSLVNAQSSHSLGFELESIFSPMENLHLTLVYSYQDAVFDNFHSPTPGGLIRDPTTNANFMNLKGNTVPQAPRNKVTFLPQYVLHLPTGDLSLSSTITWTDSQYYGVFNTPQYFAPDYYNVDLRAIYQPAKSHWTLIAYARNVTDSLQYIYRGPGQSTGLPVFPLQQTVYTLSEPRSFGAEVQYRF